MATGYEVSGRGDLDGLFKPRVSSPAAATGFLVSGVDLSQRYEPRGATAAIAATGFLSGATDLAQIFMDIAAVSSGHSMTAAIISVNFAGYDDGIAASAAGGSFSPVALGPNEVSGVAYNNTTARTTIRLRHASVAPADSDASFIDATFTGVFADSGGATVSRIQARSAALSTSTGAGGGYQWRSWVMNPVAKFISGNTYTVTFRRT